MLVVLLATALACDSGPYRVAGGRLHTSEGSYSVRRADEVYDAARALHACGDVSEAAALLEWRDQRRRVWLSLAGGCVALVPWAWTPGHVRQAREARRVVEGVTW